MGTRGLVGIRNNQGLLVGYYNHWDSYYSRLGEEVLDLYFDEAEFDCGQVLEKMEEEPDFLQDGLFCEYAYIYNSENDTLEIYRGFFKQKQSFGIDISSEVLNALDFRKGEREKYFCHLIMIIDKKKHTKEQVLEAFRGYEELRKEDEEEGENYPERKIIPLVYPKDYVPLV